MIKNTECQPSEIIDGFVLRCDWHLTIAILD